MAFMQPFPLQSLSKDTKTADIKPKGCTNEANLLAANLDPDEDHLDK